MAACSIGVSEACTVSIVLNIVLSTDITQCDEGKGDDGVNGCSDAVMLPSNTSSPMHQLLNLQRNPQVVKVAVLFFLFAYVSIC